MAGSRILSAEREKMGEPNSVLNVFMKKPDRIRSVLEYYLGEKMPEDWVLEAGDGFYSVRNSRGKMTYRQRDIIRRVRTPGFHFQLGLENQYTINLIYPWRLMEMDSCAYGEDIERIQERNNRQKIRYGTEDDFKYCYREEDRLEPILNLTLYWGTKKWRNPLSVRDMVDMDRLPEKLQHLVGDYRVHLIHMRSIPESELQKMDSDLKYVLGFMKCTRSQRKYVEYIHRNREYFSKIPKSAVDVIDVCTNIKDIRKHLQFADARNTRSGEEEADMCVALDAIIRDAEKRGKRQGTKDGIQQGIRQGAEQGITRVNKLVKRLLADGRQDDLLRSASDALFQKRLFREYHI